MKSVSDNVSRARAVERPASQSRGTNKGGLSGKKPSPKQVEFAFKLIRRLAQDDYGSFTTFGLQDIKSERDLEKMSADAVSRIIDIVKQELE